jgi:DNA-directed RNA polymerase subunit M/transcription elongation factor TFIIS
MSTPCIVLQQKGTIRQTTIENLEIAEIAKVLRRAQHPEKIGEWVSEEIKFAVYGYIKGRSGTESKHKIPSPYDEIDLFGDILIVASTEDGALHACTTKTWETFLEEQKEEEEEEEEESDSESESEEIEEVKEEEEEVEVPVEEEEEEAPPPPRRRPSARKKPNRRLPAYYALSEVETDSSADVEHPFRDSIRGVIALKLSMLSSSDQIDLEKGIFRSTLEACRMHYCWRRWENPEFQSHYQVIARRTITNLDPTSYVKNTELLAAVLSKTIAIHEVPFLPMTELFPAKWKPMVDQQIKQEIQALEGDKDMASNMFKCKACGKSQTTYYELQTRSADEPMTVFIRCIPCGKQWRQ